MKNLIQMAAALISILIAYPSVPQTGQIRRVDFRYFSYPWDGLPDSTPMSWRWMDSSAKTKVRLANGLHKFIDPHAEEVVKEHSPALRLDSITYGDLGIDGAEEAAVALNYTT